MRNLKNSIIILLMLLFTLGCKQTQADIPEGRTVAILRGPMVTGTGWIYKKDIVITNEHVCANKPKHIRIKNRAYRILWMSAYANIDVCIIKTTYKSKYEAIEINPKVEYGEITTYAGFPEGLYNVRSGQIIGKGQVPWINIIVGHVDILVLGGASGSPLYNVDNEIVGMIFATRLNASFRYGLFIPAKWIITALKKEGLYQDKQR